MSESPQPSGTTGLETWAEEWRFLSVKARGRVFPDRGGARGLSEY